MRIGSLFSGAGGLDMAVQAVFGGEVVWHAEIDKAASKVLAYRFPGVPNLGDISAVEWADVPAVDVLCGGFPCQDVSAAGKRAGIKDGTRSGLWAVFADAIDALRPQWVVIENVRGLLSATAHRDVESDDAAMGDRAGRPVLRAAGAVLGDLADLGYDAQWATVAAASVGAPHRRERVFVVASVADANGERRVSQELTGRMVTSQPWVDGNQSPLPSDAPHAPRNRRHEGRPESATIVGGFDAAVRSDGPGVALLPTPCVVDRLATTDMTLDQWDESRRSQKERGVGSFGPRGDSLGAAVLRVEEGVVDDRPDYSSSRKDDGVALLPTPRSSDTNGAGQHGDGGMDLRTTISLLPTPTATDGSGGGVHAESDMSESAGPNCARSKGDKLRDLVKPMTQWGKYAAAIARWEQIVGPAPAPTEPNKNGNPRLSAAFSQWLMGWPAGWVTHPDIGISRSDQLRIIGNGVVLQQAIAALRYLLAVAAGTQHTHTSKRPSDMTSLLPTPTSRDHKGPNQRGDTTCLHGAINQVTP